MLCRLTCIMHHISRSDSALGGRSDCWGYFCFLLKPVWPFWFEFRLRSALVNLVHHWSSNSSWLFLYTEILDLCLWLSEQSCDADVSSKTRSHNWWPHDGIQQMDHSFDWMKIVSLILRFRDKEDMFLPKFQTKGASPWALGGWSNVHVQRIKGAWKPKTHQSTELSDQIGCDPGQQWPTLVMFTHRVLVETGPLLV